MGEAVFFVVSSIHRMAQVFFGPSVSFAVGIFGRVVFLHAFAQKQKSCSHVAGLSDCGDGGCSVGDARFDALCIGDGFHGIISICFYMARVSALWCSARMYRMD